MITKPVRHLTLFTSMEHLKWTNTSSSGEAYRNATPRIPTWRRPSSRDRTGSLNSRSSDTYNLSAKLAFQQRLSLHDHVGFTLFCR